MSTQTIKEFALEFRTEIAGPYGLSIVGALVGVCAVLLPLIWTSVTMTVVMLCLLLVSLVLIRWPLRDSNAK